MLNGQRKHVSAPKRGRETFPCSFCFSVDQQCRSAVGRSYSKTQILREVKMAIQAFCSVSFRFRRTRSFSRRLQSSVFLKQPYHHFFPYPSLEFAFPSFFPFIFPFLYWPDVPERMQKSCFRHELWGRYFDKEGTFSLSLLSRLSAWTLLILTRGLLATYLPFSSTDPVFWHFIAPKQISSSLAVSRWLQTDISPWFSFQRTVHRSSLILPRFQRTVPDGSVIISPCFFF